MLNPKKVFVDTSQIEFISRLSSNLKVLFSLYVVFNDETKSYQFPSVCYIDIKTMFRRMKVSCEASHVYKIDEVE